MENEEIKVYLSLPISGYDVQERRQTATHKSAELMYRHDDWQVVNPFHIYDRMKAELLSSGVFDEPHYDDIMSADLAELSTCQLAYFMKGWHSSKGCQKEMEFCREHRINVVFEEN